MKRDGDVEKEGKILYAKAEKIMNDYEGKKSRSRNSYCVEARQKDYKSGNNNVTIFFQHHSQRSANLKYYYCFVRISQTTKYEKKIKD